jgi:hypothetical protein
MNSNYDIIQNEENYRIFPKGQDGKSRPVRVWNRHIICKHKRSGETVTFKAYLHRNTVYYRDLRDSGPSTYRDVHAALSRLCKDENLATTLLQPC